MGPEWWERLVNYAKHCPHPPYHSQPNTATGLITSMAIAAAGITQYINPAAPNTAGSKPTVQRCGTHIPIQAGYLHHSLP